MKQGLREDAFPRVAHAKVVHRYVEVFRDQGMSREFAKAVCARYKVDSTGLKDILSLTNQRALVQNMSNGRTSDTFEGCIVRKRTGTLKVQQLSKKRPSLAFLVSCERCSTSVRMAEKLC